MASKKHPTGPSRQPAAPKAPAGSWENPLIPNARLQAIYAAMLHTQLLEAHLLPARQRTPEALAAGLLLNLRATDTLASTSPAHRFLKGVPLKSLLARRQPRTVDHGFPQQHVLPAIANSAAAAHAAVGAAFAHQHAAPHDSNVVLAFIDDELECLAAARLAELHRLPILFIYLQNAADPTLALRARRLGIPGIPGIPLDRDDAVAAYRVAQEGIARARAGGGPTLVECLRYTVPQPRKTTSITVMEAFLSSKKLFTASWKQALLAAFRRDLAAAAPKS